MIAAVIDPAGETAAAATLSRIASSWSTTRVRGGAIVAASGDVAHADAEECGARDAMTLGAAAAAARHDAFVALDAEVEGAVLLARGSLGGRPLYYARTDGGAWIACSRLEPLLRAAGRRFPPDADRLASLAVGQADPRDHATAFAGIARVPPVAAIRLHGARAETRVRSTEHREPLTGSVEELAEELWRRVEAAVRRAVDGKKHVAVMVGGGVDSSGLLAAAVAWARGASEREVTAIALDFDAIGTDRPYLAALASDLGIVPVRLPPRDASPWFGDSFVLDAQPYILTIGPMEQLVFRRARERGAELLLTGYLADEILAGDLRGLAAEALSGSPRLALRRAMRLRLPWDTTARERVERYVVRPILKPLIPRRFLAHNGARDHERDYPWAGARTRRVLAEIRAAAGTLRPPRTPSDRFDRFARSSLLADYADWRGQMEATTGLVRKDPYADEDTLDLLSRVRPSVLCHDDWYRGLFRAALRGRVPESIRMRADKSCFEPAFAEVADAAGGLASLGDLWDVSALERLEVVDARRFKAAMEPLFRAPASTQQSAELWSAATQVLACEAFARRCEASG